MKIIKTHDTLNSLFNELLAYDKHVLNLIKKQNAHVVLFNDRNYSGIQAIEKGIELLFLSQRKHKPIYVIKFTVGYIYFVNSFSEIKRFLEKALAKAKMEYQTELR